MVRFTLAFPSLLKISLIVYFTILPAIIQYPFFLKFHIRIWLFHQVFLYFLHFFPECGIIYCIPKFKEVFDVRKRRHLKRKPVACLYSEVCQSSGQTKCQNMKSSKKSIPCCFCSGGECQYKGFCFAEHSFNCMHAGPRGRYLPCYNPMHHSRK